MNAEARLLEVCGAGAVGEPPYALPCTRAQLPYLFAKWGFRVGAEIGVEQGRYSQQLLAAMPGLCLHCVDCWEAYPGYRESSRYPAERVAGFYAAARARLAEYGERAVFHRARSVEAAEEFRDSSLDFVFIDANHTREAVTADLAAWEPKVRSGGVVYGHDFYDLELPDEAVEVASAVRAWVAEHGIGTWFVTPDPCWLWVKR